MAGPNPDLKQQQIDAFTVGNGTSTIWIDGNYAGTKENGSYFFPYKTWSAASVAMAANTAAYGFELYVACAVYTEAQAVTLPAKPITIHGNQAVVTFAAGITIPNGNYTRYDLNTIGDIVFSGATPGKAIVQGGSITGNVTVGGGTAGTAVLLDIKSCSLLGNAHVITVSEYSTLAAIVNTFTCRVAGAGNIQLEKNNFNTSYAGYLVTSTGGTLSSVNNIIVNASTNAAAGGISCDNGATGLPTAGNPTGNGRMNAIVGSSIYVPYGTGYAVGTATTVISENYVVGGVANYTGTGRIGANDTI